MISGAKVRAAQSIAPPTGDTVSDRYQHYGWSVSPYAAKTRAWLTYKGLPFDDIDVTAFFLNFTVRRIVRREILPTVKCPDGTWLQDTSVIIDTLEARHPEPGTVPPGPTQRIASLLLELHGDEWLLPVVIHTRWNIPENARYALDAFGRLGFPRLPRPLGKLLMWPLEYMVRKYGRMWGIRPETIPGIEAFLRELIARLDTHLSDHPYLLGGRPCLGDFALFGPLWAHVYSDPGSRAFFDDAPAVRAWLDRLCAPPERIGEFLPDDAVPETLDPIFETLFAEQMPALREMVEVIDAWCEAHPKARRMPRNLDERPFTIGGHAGMRHTRSFTQFMLQRPVDAYAALEPAQRAAVDRWLGRVGGAGALDITIRNRLVRHNFLEVLEDRI